MAKVYAEFGIEIFDNSIVDDCFKIMHILGEVKKSETKRKSVVIDYCTSVENIVELENLSDSLCDVIEPHIKVIKSLLDKNSDKLYTSICFVKTSDDINDIALKINMRLISLANTLNIEIHFDGF
ncbi:MAG: hypothetical protein ACI4LX_05195 [Treponema sp.]